MRDRIRMRTVLGSLAASVAAGLAAVLLARRRSRILHAEHVRDDVHHPV